MLQTDLHRLPTSEELPCSDDTPVDNEDQNLLPNILLFLLDSIWADRTDWYFGVDMAVYHPTGENSKIAVVPDAFLSLGVERTKRGKSRTSYVVWEERDVVPVFVLEMVSQTAGEEYTDKFEIYRKLAVRYYLIYNPEFWRRDKHQPFELYKLIDGQYELQAGDPYWMSEVGLAIGRCQRALRHRQQEQLAWFDAKGDRYLTPQEQAEQERQQLAVERQRTAAEREAKKQANQRAELEREAKEQANQRAEAEREAKEQANQRAEVEREAKEQANQRAEVERQRAKAERQRAERLEALLRSQGLDPADFPDL
jgi:Uma2 family endonuclease